MKIKILVSILSLFVSQQASAQSGECVAKETGSIHEGFCSNLPSEFCSKHLVCNWKTEEKVIKVIIEQAPSKCVAKDGFENQESFCNSHDKQICKIHTALCEWK